MANQGGAYQPFGSGWSNLSNYLTQSNIGTVKDGAKAGSAQMSMYGNPDVGGAFDDWIAGIYNTKNPVAQNFEQTANPENDPWINVRRMTKRSTGRTYQENQPERNPTRGYSDPRTGGTRHAY